MDSGFRQNDITQDIVFTSMPHEKPVLDINDEYAIRLNKLHDLGADGESLYPAKAGRVHLIKEALSQDLGSEVVIAGRIMTKRDMGKLTFCHIQDESGRIQVALKKDDLSEEEYIKFAKKIM